MHFPPTPFLLSILLPTSSSTPSCTAKAKQAPWFPQHETRDIYVSLLSMEPPASRPVLIAALIRRAMTDVQRIVEVRNSKMALQTLLQKGQIGDDTWNHLLETEKELEAELMEVVGEANHFRPGWGQIIFAHASDMVQHEKHRKIFENIEKEREKASESMSMSFRSATKSCCRAE